MKILFLMQNLGGGGAEKVLVNLVNNLDSEKFDITIKTIFGGGVNAEKLNKNVKYLCRRKKQFKGISRIYALLPAKWLYRNIIGKEQYDVVIAYMHGIPTKIIYGAPKNTKKIAWLHTGDMKTISIFKCFLTYSRSIRALKQFDAIVGVSKTVCDNFTKRTGITEKVYTCYNTNETEKILLLAKEKVELPCKKKPIICSVGRFTPEKGFSRLIDISKRLNGEGEEHSLVIIGDGLLRDDLRNKVKQMQYEDVYFTGYQKNPYAYLGQVDMFVCSSYYEGLSTATTEAVILGLPCVSTEVSGASEILTPDTQGIIVENTDEALYEGIKKMLGKIARGEIDKKKIQNSAERFSVKNTVGKVEELLLSIKEK